MATQTPGIKAIGHTGMCVADLDVSVRFWTQALGFEVIRAWDFGEAWGRVNEVEDARMRVNVLRRGHVTVEMVEFTSPGHVGSTERAPANQVGLTHLAVWVDDLDLAAQRIVDHGGAIVESTRTVFDHPKFTGRWLCCTDPNGVRLELVEYPAGEDLIDW